MPGHRRSSKWARSEDGFTVVDVLMGITVLSIGALALGGVIVTTSQASGQDAGRYFMLQQVQERLEEIRGTAPELVLNAFHGQLYTVKPDATQGDEPVVDSGAIAVTVSEPRPSFLEITLTADWTTGGVPGNLTVTTGMYIP